jgi:hypothetical protein
MDPYPPLPPPPPGGHAEVEEAEPEGPTRSAGKAIAVVAGLFIAFTALVAGGVWWLGGPDACDTSTVESPRFGYCVAAPGWQFTNEATQTELPYDELIKPADASTVRIVAIQLQTGQGLDDVAQAARDIVTQEGVQVGDVVERHVAGVPAAQWDFVLDAGQVEQHVRQIVFVRGETAWHIQLSADAGGFAIRADEFNDILRTWTFR